MLPQTRSASTDRIILALCTSASHKLPAKLLSIDTACWTLKSVYVKDDRQASAFMNCVAISDDLILVALAYSYAVYNKELHEISNFDRQSIDPRCDLIMSLTDSFLKSHLVMVLDVDPFDCKNSYDAVDSPDFNSWLMKSEIDHQSGKLTPHEVADNSILLKNAMVESVTEVAVDKLLVHIHPTDLIHVNGW